MKKVIIIILLTLTLSGCYNYKELNDLVIVSGVSIAKVDDAYEITVAVVNPKREQDSSGSNEPDFVIYSSSGNSIQTTLRSIIKECPQRLYFPQMELLILDESIVEEGIDGVLDFFAREPEVRSEFYVLVGKTDEVLEVTTTLETTSATNIVDSLIATNEYIGVTNLVTYHDLLENVLDSKKELALPSVKTVGDTSSEGTIENIEKTEADTMIVLSNIAIFKDNKLAGYLTEEESLVYNLTQNDITSALIRTDYEDDSYIIHELLNVSVSTEFEESDNKIKINISGKSSITEVNYDVDLTNNETIKKLESDLNKKIEAMVSEDISDIIRKYNSDIFGFQDLIYKTNPSYYKMIKDDWYKTIFPYLEIEVTSEVVSSEKGNLNGGGYYG